MWWTTRSLAFLALSVLFSDVCSSSAVSVETVESKELQVKLSGVVFQRLYRSKRKMLIEGFRVFLEKLQDTVPPPLGVPFKMKGQPKAESEDVFLFSSSLLFFAVICDLPLTDFLFFFQSISWDDFFRRSFKRFCKA